MPQIRPPWSANTHTHTKNLFTVQGFFYPTFGRSPGTRHTEAVGRPTKVTSLLATTSQFLLKLLAFPQRFVFVFTLPQKPTASKRHLLWSDITTCTGIPTPSSRPPPLYVFSEESGGVQWALFHSCLFVHWAEAASWPSVRGRIENALGFCKYEHVHQASPQAVAI